MACDNYGIHEGAVMWMLPSSTKESAAAASLARLSLKLKSSHYSGKEGVLTNYCKVVSHLLYSYFQDHIIVDTDCETSPCAKLFTMSPLEFCEWPLAQDASMSNVYHENIHKGIFVEYLPQWIRQIMEAYWSGHKTAMLQKMAYQSTSLTKLESAARPGHWPALYTSNQHHANILQTNCCPDNIWSIGSSRKHSPEDQTA